MNWLDIVIIVVAFLCAIPCLRRGAIRTAFSAAGIVLGIFLAGHYYHSLANLFSSDDATWAGIAAFALILIATLVIATIAGWVIARIVQIMMLGWLDKLVGFVLGAGIGGMLCAAILTIISKYFPSAGEVIAQSVLARFLMDQFPLLLALLPEEFDRVRDFFQ